MRSNHLIKQSALNTGALVALVLAIVVLASTWLQRPIMGLRGIMLPPVVEVIDTNHDDAHVWITVKNNDSNPIIGEAGYIVVNGENSVLYGATPASFGPLLPGSTEQLVFEWPSNQPEGAEIQAWAREQIAYINSPQKQGLSIRNHLTQGILIDSVTVETTESGDFHLSVVFRLTNYESKSNVFRYTVGLTRLEEQAETLATEAPTVFSQFVEISLSPSESHSVAFEESNLVIESGMYSVSVWVQARDQAGDYFQWAQETYALELIVP